MAKSAIIVRTERELRGQIWEWRGLGHKIGLVPTMGALHGGHLSLAKHARQHADKVVASIFVNPAQFAEGEDLGTYPRQEGEDIRLLESVGCDMVYIPNPGSMYDENHSTRVDVGGAALGLETDFRPHFFGGVALIVTKLLNRVQPDIAVFGEKDFQQLLTIRRLTKDLDMPIEIVGAPIIREPDGLAMSSRNAYLSKKDRQIASQLNVIMRKCAASISKGADIETATTEARDALISAGFASVDYVSVADRENLSLINGHLNNQPARLLLAATCNTVRLIDNCDIA
jgi:pantoate--beta-alanine ligase